MGLVQYYFTNTNELYLFTSEKKVYGLVEEFLNRVPLFQRLPTYKGFINPVRYCSRIKTAQGNTVLRIFYKELYGEVIDFLSQFNDITIEKLEQIDQGAGRIHIDYQLAPISLERAIESWNLKLEPRDYQIQAVDTILKYNYSLSELATRSGKTMIVSLVSRYVLGVLGYKKILMVVPNVQLVKQAKNDFEFYFGQDPFGTLQISGSTRKLLTNEEITSGNFVIGTFQSLIKMDRVFFKQFDVLIVDEAHKLPCKSIKDLYEACSSVKFRFGLTGTLPKKDSIEYLGCVAMMGSKVQTIEGIELVDRGVLARPRIYQVFNKVEDVPVEDQKKIAIELLKDSSGQIPVGIEGLKSSLTSLKKVLGTMNKGYHFENLLLQSSLMRFSLLKVIIYSRKTVDNGIIFAHNTEYIQKIKEYLEKDLDPNLYKIRVITGKTTIKQRNQIMEELNSPDAQRYILIGSYGSIGTGLTFHNMDYGILFQSFQSEIINKQSLGRLMLPGYKNKEFFDVYDVVDSNLPRIKKHGQIRKKMMEEAGYQILQYETE